MVGPSTATMSGLSRGAEPLHRLRASIPGCRRARPSSRHARRRRRAPSASAKSTGPQSAAPTPTAMPGSSRHHRVGLRAEARPPNLLDHHRVGAVHLIGRGEQSPGSRRDGARRGRGSPAPPRARRSSRCRCSARDRCRSRRRPARVKKACAMPGSASAGASIGARRWAIPCMRWS